MRFLVPPTSDSPTPDRSENDLDRLLQHFFRAEMPGLWPAAPVADEPPAILSRPAPSRSSRSLFRSRLVLAASVAFLLALPWALSDSFRSLTSTPPDITLGGETANRDLKYKT